jgi:hypothetical protein
MRIAAGDRVDLADTAGISEVRLDEVRQLHRGCVAECERGLLDGADDRLPDVHHCEAPGYEHVGFVREEVAHALRPGGHRVVVVDEADRLLREALGFFGARPTSHVEVEGLHPPRAGVLGDEFGHLREVDAANGVGIEEAGGCGRQVLESEALAVEARGGQLARAPDRQRAAVAVGVAPARPFRRRVGVVVRSLVHRSEVVEGGFDHP